MRLVLSGPALWCAGGVFGLAAHLSRVSRLRLVLSGPALSAVAVGVCGHDATCATARSAAEPAWHRRQRARRGQDRLLLRLLRARQRLDAHHSAQMGRGQNRSAGHNHILAALADAIHAGSSYKSKGKGKNGKEGGSKGQYPQWGGQDGRNCPSCNDYNFGFRSVCRQCGAWLPPPRVANAADKGQKSSGKATAAPNYWSGAGKGPTADNGYNPASSAGAGTTPAAAAAKVAAGTDHDEVHDPAERVRDIRSEEEKLRRSRAQYADINPTLVDAIDKELAKLASEREKLQPLEVNLQAAAGRTANARAALSKAKEKKAMAAKELREYMERYKAAEKEVSDAETRLSAAEAAATAKRTDAKAPTTVQQAMEVLHQTATSRCGDTAVAAQVSAALQQIADILGAITAPTDAATAEATGNGADGAATGTPPQRVDSTAGGSTGEKGKGGTHPVFAVCGATENKSRRTVPSQQSLAAYTGPGDPAGRDQRDDSAGDGTNSGQSELYAGGAVDGEVTMGASRDDSEPTELLSQAAALLGDDESGEL